MPMTDLERAEQYAKSARHGERIRWDERQRAFDILDLAAYGKPDDVATALWEAAAEIMRHKP